MDDRVIITFKVCMDKEIGGGGLLGRIIRSGCHTLGYDLIRDAAAEAKVDGNTICAFLIRLSGEKE